MNGKYENNIILSGGVRDLDKSHDSVQFIVKADTVVNAINLHNNMSLKFIVEKGVTLVFNVFDYAVSLETNVEIEADDETSFVMNVAFIAETKYDLNVETKLYGSNINGILNVRGINEREGTVRVLMNGTVAGETKGNVLNEYAKVLNKSDHSNVLIPNLIVNTSEVEANHGVSIGHIDERQLFYMMSKGLSKYSAVKMIEEGFLIDIMSDDIKQKIQNILVGR